MWFHQTERGYRSHDMDATCESWGLFPYHKTWCLPLKCNTMSLVGFTNVEKSDF